LQAVEGDGSAPWHARAPQARIGRIGASPRSPAPAKARPPPGERHRYDAVGALLAGHVLSDGEVIQLILKPSLWFIHSPACASS